MCLQLCSTTGIPVHTFSVGVLRDIDTIWKLNLTYLLMDKQSRNKISAASACNGKHLFSVNYYLLWLQY